MLALLDCLQDAVEVVRICVLQLMKEAVGDVICHCRDSASETTTREQQLEAEVVDIRYVAHVVVFRNTLTPLLVRRSIFCEGESGPSVLERRQSRPHPSVPPQPVCT